MTNFEIALAHAMKWEVGGWFDPNDPDTQKGLITTREQMKKVGYVNDPADSGGETKFGVAQNANPNIKVRTMNYDAAKKIYETNYWKISGCDKLALSVAIFHFDTAVNCGVGRAIKFLQTALGVTVDGKLGKETYDAISEIDQDLLLQKLFKLRTQYYKDIVSSKPSQEKFLKGWMARVQDVYTFAIHQ